MIRFTVPGKPAPLQRARAVRRGSFIKVLDTEDNKVNKATVGWYGKAAMGGKPLLQGPLAMTIEFRLPKPKSKIKVHSTPFPLPDSKPDIDNLGKMILDALSQVVYEDDAQIVTLTLRKRWAKPSGPETTIWIDHESTRMMVIRRFGWLATLLGLNVDWKHVEEEWIKHGED